MRKKEELSAADSCLNRAGDDELIFVLLGRDVAAPAAIYAWVAARLSMGKNQITDQQITNALQCAKRMELERSLTRVRE